MKDIANTIFRRTNWKPLKALAQWVIDEGIRVQQIPAPTFAEDERATYVSEQFKNFGLSNVSIDDAKNVYGLVKGTNRSVPAIMVLAHTDTVFSAETDLKIERKGDTIYGAGLGDNSMGVSGMLGLAKWLYDTNTSPSSDIWFVASSCEEGLGDLKGIRAAYEKLKDQIGLVINLEGLAYGHIYHAGIAVHRLHITAKAEGGHSWLHYGRPSAVHGIMELGAQINRLNPPTKPRTTYNIGMIDGGTAINALGTEASLWLDMRSEEQQSLDKLREQVHLLINAVQRKGLDFEVEVVGNRPAGSISSSHPLVQGALATLSQLGLRGALETGSTDGNIPLANGCPTVTIGITNGGNAHRLDEYIETKPVHDGMKQLITLALASVEFQHQEHAKLAGD
ncbi:MAG: M20/M25/M40 family metallo-hydrolase [Phototrophicaceae bacterium]